jgi:uncharacterized membrane protein YphA (DoxX/SURF4 family)/thiol-disulfide isomerase/thioredoxin
VDLLLLSARVGLALIFIAAAVGKLLDAEGSRRALREFKVPPSWVPTIALLLPVVELAVAAGLLTQPLARPMAAAAIVLFAGFAFGVAAALRRGNAPDCHCFGQLHSARAGRGTLVRNALLALPAGLVVWSGPGDVLAGRSPELGMLVAAAALVAALAAATYILVRENRRLRSGAPAGAERPTLVVGAPAPELRLRDAAGRSTGIGDVIARDRPTALVFVSPGCGPCESLLPHLARWRTALAERVELVVISDPPDGEEGADAFSEFPGMVWDEEGRSLEAFRVNYGTPAAVILDSEGSIASTPVSGIEGIEALIRVAQRRAFTSRPLAVA